MLKVKKFRNGKYKVSNWSEYNKSLKRRGDLTIWFSQEGIDNWLEDTTFSRTKARGRQRQYSDIAIQTIYTIRQVYNLRLRQSEGFARSILGLLGIELPTPDYTTISRRIRDVSVDFITQNSTRAPNINLIIDSTGIKVVGEREWMSYKYYLKQRKVWRKLHIGVTDKGEIVTGEVTRLRDSDIATVPLLLSQIKNKVVTLVGDGAYYRRRMEHYIINNEATKEAKFIGPPSTGKKPCYLTNVTASKNIRNYGNRLKVEETFSRYKRIIGNKFKATNFQAQQNEAKLSLFILNKMQDLGMPKTIRIA